MADQPKPTKKYASTLDVLKQSVREKFSDTEIHEDPAVRAQIDKVENHKKVVTDLSRHLTALKKSHTQGKAEEKNLIESWTVYADKLSTAAECPELEKAMRKLILVEKYVEEITGKMNDTYGEKVVTPVHNYGDTELRDALRWKDRYNDIRVRYDALCAKKSSSEKHAQDKVECQKDLSKMGEQTIEALKKAYARSEFVHFEAIIGRYEALVEFFDLGQLYMNERKAEIAQFKADFERRKLELATGKKVDVTRAPGGATVFGVPLLELLGREKRPDTDVPLLVEKCCEYLYAKGLDSEGLFRVSPAGSQLEKFKTEANRGSYDFSWITDPNVVAGGLKFFLRSLPDPIFTAERYRGWLNCIGRGDETLELEALKKLIENLPPQNLVIVKTIMLLLKAVLEHEEKNKMTPKALCVVMGPNLIWSREATKPEDMMVDAEKTNALLTLMMKNVPFLFTEKNIWKLIKRGDVDGTRKLAESEKVDLLTSADETGQYALHVAAKLGFLPMVKYMIEEVKMPVDQKDLLEVTALGHALMNKNEDVALYLVEKRANTRSDFKDKVDFESRAKLCGQPFFTKYQELVLKVNKEEREKAEAEAKRKADEKDRAEKEVAAKLRAEEEARWAKELEVAQKRAARENPALAALGAQVVPGPPPPVSVDPQELARAAERERAERAQAEKERAEREEKEREERRKLLDRERDQMLQEKEAKRLKEIADQKAQEEREREERERIVAEKERDRLAAMDRALQDSRASMAPPMPLTRPAVPLPRPPGGSARAAPTPQAQPALRSSAGGIAPRNPPGDADPDAPPTPLGLSNRSRVSSTPTAPSPGVQSSSPAPAALLPTPQAAPAAAAASASDDAALPRLEQLLLSNKLNLPELLAAVCRLVRLCVAPALDLPACNTAVRELAVEVKGLFNHGDAEVLAESSDEDRDALFAQARKLQEGMKQVIGALKELSQSAEPADRVPALLRSLAFIVGPAVGVFSAFEAVVGAQVAGLTGAAANQLTTALQIAVGKAPATELPALAEASASHYSALAEIVRLKALEVADPEAEEKLSQAANTLLSSRAALFQTASTLLATPSDDMAKANLSAVAKVLAAQFSLLNSHAAALPLHRTVSAAGRAAADAQEERDIRSLRDLMGMLSLPDPDIGRRLSAALEGLLLLRSLPVTQGILYFDACHRVAEAVRSAARHTLSMRQVQASPALQREVTRATAAAVHLAAFAEVIGSAHALNLALDPEAALNHVVAGLLHALSLLARHLSTL